MTECCGEEMVLEDGWLTCEVCGNNHQDINNSIPTEVIIKSPNDTKWKVTVDDAGVITTEEVVE